MTEEINTLKDMLNEETQRVWPDSLEYTIIADKRKKALSMAIDALEKQMPKKIIVKHIKETNCDIQYCPVCHVELGEFWPKFEEVPSFCTYCGQALDWSEVEE